MNTEKFKSVVRHALTAIGTLLVFFGLNSYVPLVDYLTENLDGTVQAVEGIKKNKTVKHLKPSTKKVGGFF